MSTDVEPPSSPKLSFTTHNHSKSVRKTTPHGPPPAAFDTQADHRKHGRSASFSGFVSRMLPSRRPEKGHALRAGFQDGGPHNAVDLVFGLADDHRSSVVATGETGDGSSERKIKSWAPHNPDISGAHSPADQAVRSNRSGGSYENRGEIRRRPRSLSIGWLLASKRVEEKEDNVESVTAERGEGTHLRKYSTPLGLPQRSPDVSQGIDIPRSSASVLDVESSKSRQLFDKKKSHREQRKSLRESGDFLGVQGANPRTGMWDLSDNTTSSSAPSHVSSETKRKLEQHAKELKESKLKYEEAKSKQRVEIQRVQTLKELKRKEKVERKKSESKSKQKRRGKWKVGDNGWSSVAEPGLSPILQSVAATPTREIPSFDKLLPMPCSADADPFWKDASIATSEYFPPRGPSSPLALGSFEQSNVMKKTPLTQSSAAIKRKPVGSPPSRGSGSGSTETIVHVPSHLSETTPTIKKAVPPKLADEDSAAVIELKVPGQFSSLNAKSHTPSKPYHFLDIGKGRATKRSPYERLATVISFQSVPTSQVRIHEPSPDSRRVFSHQGKVISSLSELPPVSLKDPVAARTPSRIPLSSQPQRIQPNIQTQVWAPPTIIDTKTDKPGSHTNTSTTTTTGFTPLRRALAQLDGQDDYESNGNSHLTPREKTSRIPLRSSSLPNNKRKSTPKEKFPTHTVGTDTYSEHHLDQTKHRTERLCQTASPKEKKEPQKSTLTSTSTFPRSTNQKALAHNAALIAFQSPKAGRSTEPKEAHSSDAPTAPKVRLQKLEGNAGRVKTGSPTRLPRTKRHDIKDTIQVGTPTGELHHVKRNAVALSHPAPERKRKVIIHEKGVSLASETPKTGRPCVSLRDVVASVLHTAWWIVGPVFDPASELRNRWAYRKLTWRDMGTFTAAGIFAVAMFTITIVFTRVLGMAFQVLRSFVSLFKLVTG
ncbi:hypothetical protein GLAREA_01995 [Glarea lozoyensis ATCC 20868]|uniref:Uncharacterized protein n=1 Tax=Glarea lozoyensis (strain ATCC 20868 / MF5171) TaxID=1116229 RepID=S3DHM5_GLAL2|nr:uncharacterized protein GLAREA_01995 [Glarea lozoyensis ATCC 20868]EPE26083.1 hypothetical protein GLAREA_01995 [Glarea lozoyensis ATCC 20868]